MQVEIDRPARRACGALVLVLVALVGAAATLDRRGRVAIRLACPGTETSCRGTLTIEAVQKPSGRAAPGRSRAARSLVLGKAAFRLAGGESRGVAVRLSKRGRGLVEDLGSLRVRAVVKARDTAGNSKTTTRLITIRPSP